MQTDLFNLQGVLGKLLSPTQCVNQA